jgi:hypothetical protein
MSAVDSGLQWGRGKSHGNFAESSIEFPQYSVKLSERYVSGEGKHVPDRFAKCDV